MRLVVEQYPYDEAALHAALPGFNHFPPANDDGKVRVGYVGYCFLPKVNDCAFFLPKVVLRPKKDAILSQNSDAVSTDDFVFGKYRPEQLLCLSNAAEERTITDEEYQFLYQLSVWVYRAISEFKRLNPDSDIVTRECVARLDDSTKRVSNTFIDILLSLVKFNEENQDFFMFVIKNMHSGYNRINWRKTISQRQPVVQHEVPIYMNPVNRKKQINFDEELLIIYFSILNYIKEQYGFKVAINYNYELITGPQFEQFRDFYGLIRLRQIKYKYFSDKALKLWQLCFDFFAMSSNIASESVINDYLIAFKFENVFEAIIDELIGSKVPKGLKEQKDGKIIDHIYPYADLVTRRDIYYIGDSKYYKIGASLGANSIYKQYTYAKNVIQYDFDLLLGDKTKADDDIQVNYRDELTEGYNVTPNFFISAEIDKEHFSFEDDGLQPHKLDGKTVEHLNRQFRNRLFDRDTLWLSHYDINFLFILAVYGRNNSADKAAFKSKARQKFRQEIIGLLDAKYEFCILEPREGYSLHRAVLINFSRLLGKVYRPHDDADFVLLALQQSEEEAANNEQLIAEISPYFYVHRHYKLQDENVNQLLTKKREARQELVTYAYKDNFVDRMKSMAAEPTTGYGLSDVEAAFTESEISRKEKIKEEQLTGSEVTEALPLEQEPVLVGYFNGEQQMRPILKNKLYYVRANQRNGSLIMDAGADCCKYVLLHQKRDLRMFKLIGEGPRVFNGAQLSKLGFSNKKPNEIYLAYRLESTDPVTFSNYDLSEVVLRGIAQKQAESYVTTLGELFGGK